MTLAERIERVLDAAPCKRCGQSREAGVHGRDYRGALACRFILDRYVTARVIAAALEREGVTR